MATKLFDSFGAMYRLLERPKVARRVLVGLLVIHTLLLGYNAYVHSPTFNEPAHLVAGLSHWKFGRFELFRVNPPLVRMVAALPVMTVGSNEDWSGFYEGPGARPEMGIGAEFVAANGERSFFLFMIARWACIPFGWLGMIVCYLWARDLFGRPSGLMASTIWCFEPNILAHASLITTDAGATALGLAACYAFWRWLKKPTWSQAALTGVVLGMAELAKTTLILFYPLWPLMWLMYRWSDRQSMFARDWLREAGMLTLRMAIGLYILNLGYGFEGSFTQLREFTFVSDLFSGKRSGIGEQWEEVPQSEIRSPISSSNFANTWLGSLPVPFPKNYLLGIDIQQKDFESSIRLSYLHGVWQDHGWWNYYLYACAIKIPLGLWALSFLALLLSFWKKLGASWLFPRRDKTAGARDLVILLFPAIVIFAVVSSKTGFNEHMRYVLPAFPFFFIAASQTSLIFCSCKVRPRWLTTASSEMYIQPLLTNRFAPVTPLRCRMTFLFKIAVGTCASWIIASSLWIYPHSLSYFNESIGGPLNGPYHLLGSNTDWGQDLLYLKKWNQQIAPDDLTLVINYSAIDPCGIGNSEGVIFPLAADDFEHMKSNVRCKYLAVSEKAFHELLGQACGRRVHTRIELSDSTIRFLADEPVLARCGYSFRIYRALQNTLLNER